jgi:hypothetical protein
LLPFELGIRVYLRLTVRYRLTALNFLGPNRRDSPKKVARNCNWDFSACGGRSAARRMRARLAAPRPPPVIRGGEPQQ